MKIKATWGFVGDAVKLGADSAKVKAGQVFEKAADAYAHLLIGKGLAEAVIEPTQPVEPVPLPEPPASAEPKPEETPPADDKPKESKPASGKETK